MKEGKIPSLFTVKHDTRSIEEVISSLPLPEVSDQDIQEMVSAVKPNSYDDISEFGLSLTLHFAKALLEISSHFTRNAARPARTFEQAETIMSAVASIDVGSVVMESPTGMQKLLDRVSRVRLVTPEQNPLFKASEAGQRFTRPRHY